MQARYLETSHCFGDEHPLNNEQTLLVNASIEDSGGRLTQRPWLVDIELPRARLGYWGIQDEGVYNFDETGFSDWGLFRRKGSSSKGYSGSIYPENKELTTSVETLNYGVRKTPPIIIFSGAYYLRR